MVVDDFERFRLVAAAELRVAVSLHRDLWHVAGFVQDGIQTVGNVAVGRICSASRCC